MTKSPDAFRTISEVADWLGVEAHVLRFWETKFSQVKPVKRAGGRRYYRPADMALLGGIRRLLHDEGMTIRGVQKILREKGIGHVAGMSPELRLDGADPVPAPPRTARPGLRNAANDGAAPAVPSEREAPPAPSSSGAAPPAPSTRRKPDAPTLPFDLPAATDSPVPDQSAGQGDGSPGSEEAAMNHADRQADPRSVPMRGGAAVVDPVAAAEVLARARALVERLRNTPE